MKATWKLGAAGALELTVDDGDRKHQWTLRKSHSPEKLAQAFREVAHALDPGVARRAADLWADDDGFDRTAAHSAPPGEPAERRALRLRAEAALAGAASAKAIMDGDEGEVAKIPEMIGRTSATEQTNTAGFTLPQAPSAAIDGTTYSNKDYRADRSNWTR